MDEQNDTAPECDDLAMNWPEVREPRVDAPCDEQRQ